MKHDLIKNFDKLLSCEICENTKIVKRDRRIYVSANGVVGIVPKKKWLEDLLSNFDVTKNNVPNFQFEDSNKKIGFYDDYRSNIIIETAKHYNKIKIDAEYHPLRIETDDFVMFIAPRVV